MTPSTKPKHTGFQANNRSVAEIKIWRWKIRTVLEQQDKLQAREERESTSQQSWLCDFLLQRYNWFLKPSETLLTSNTCRPGLDFAAGVNAWATHRQRDASGWILWVCYFNAHLHAKYSYVYDTSLYWRKSHFMEGKTGMLSIGDGLNIIVVKIGKMWRVWLWVENINCRQP